MKNRFIATCIASLGIVVCLPLPAQAVERVSANVYLNSEDKGEFIITLTDMGKVLFTRQDLLRLGINELPSDITSGEDGYVSLSPHVRAELDRNTGILRLTANPDLQGKAVSDVALEPVSGPVPAKAMKRVNAHVYLNGEDKGDYLITLTNAGKVLLVREDLLRLGIKQLPVDAIAGEDGYVSLSPRVLAEFDEKASILGLTVAHDLLGERTLDAATSPAPAPSQVVERLIANVRLNHEDKGDFFVRRTDKGKILFTGEDLASLGFDEVAADTITEDGYRSLPSRVRTEFDEKQSILYLTVAPDQLGKTTVDLARKTPDIGGLVDGQSSGFINYGLSYNADDDLEFTSLSVPLEAGITTDGYLGISSFSYVKDDDNERFVRLMTSIVRDNPESLTRFIAGDFSTSSGQLGSGGLYGGLSIAKKFHMDPYSLRYPGANLYGSVDTPSDVEVYVNGLLVSKEHLSPGEFEFKNVGNVQGSGEATIVIRDAYGRQETVTVPYYTSAQLLKPGLHDYSYSLGYQREAFGQESSEYGDDVSFLGYHRFGFSQTLTAGLRAEGDADVVNGGASATFLLGTLGEFDTSVAFSREDDTSGNGWSARYSRAGKYVSGGVFARGFSREYANLMMTGLDDKSRLEASGNIGFRQERLGSLSLFYSMKDMYEDVDRERFGIIYNRRLGRRMSLNVVAARTVTDEAGTNEIFANLMIVLGKSRSANVAYQKQGEETSARVSLQQNAPLGTGIGYRLSADRRDNGQDEPLNGGDAYIQYRGNHGIYSAEDRIVDGNNNYTVGTAGGIAFINSSAYFTRPIYDGYVLAKVGTFENVPVKYNNQEVGVTDEDGELLIPGLISYHRNDISIDDKAIPVNYELSDINKSVTVPYRAGGVVRFDMEKLQGFTGRLLIRDRGEMSPAEYWGLRINQGAESMEVIVGKNGEFYLENLPAGHLPARLFRKDETCSFELAIPESDDVMVNMGEVICERN